MSSPTITYVQLVNGDPVWDLSAQLADLYAVAQAISTRLKLFLGEFWAAKNDGTPVFQSILGQAASAAAQQQIASLLSARITGTPYVVGITNLQVGFVLQTRAFTYYAVVNTQFGQLVVSNFPQPPSGALP
jgi:hypothetical protein